MAVARLRGDPAPAAMQPEGKGNLSNPTIDGSDD